MAIVHGPNHLNPRRPLSPAEQRAMLRWHMDTPFGAVLKHRARFRRWPMIDGDDPPPRSPAGQGRAAA